MTALAHVAAIAGCLGVALVFAATDHRLRLGGLIAVGAAASALGAVVAPSARPVYVGAVAALIVSAAVLVPLALTRWPWALAFVTLLLVPARIPVEVDGTSSKLLLPLYLLAIGSGSTIFVETLRGDRRSRELGPLALPLAGFVLWSGVSLLWSPDVDAGAMQLLAYYLPFSMIVAGLARLPWSRRALTWLAVELLAMALLFTAIGYEQYRTRNVFWNPKVIVGDAYAPFFRVNSVFWDPSIYGRFLMAAMLVALVVVVRGRSLRNAMLGAGAIAVAGVGLLLSYSQSSLGGLIVGVLIVTAIVWRRRAILAVAAVALVLVAVGAASPHVRNGVLHRSVTELDRSTSGRATLVTNGIRVAADHPLWGTGLGGFRHDYAEIAHLRGREPKKAASHTTPITVAAEGGVVGLGLFAWSLALVLWLAFRRPGRSFEQNTALALGLVAAGILVHSLSYANFFEDPMAWAMLGLVPLAAAARETAAERVPAPAAEPAPAAAPEPEPQGVLGARPAGA